jgi:hypothetical protein
MSSVIKINVLQIIHLLDFLLSSEYPDVNIAKNAGCEAVGVRGLTGEDLSSKVNESMQI